MKAMNMMKAASILKMKGMRSKNHKTKKIPPLKELVKAQNIWKKKPTPQSTKQ